MMPLRSRSAIGLSGLVVIVIIGLGVLLSRQTPAASPGGSWVQGHSSGSPDNNAGVSTIYTGSGAPFAGGSPGSGSSGYGY